MAKISDAEVRRLLSYLKQFIDEEKLAAIEDELRGDYAEEFLREPDLLQYFPELLLEITAGNKNWKLRVIPHAHLRMIQRAIKLTDLSIFFRSFIELCTVNEQPIFIGHYALFGRPKLRSFFITIRVDLDKVTDSEGFGHIVTVHIGRGNTEGIIEVDLPAS